MVQLVEVTDDEDIYYDYIRNNYIKCPRTRAFPHKEHERWPEDGKSIRKDFLERRKWVKLKNLNLNQKKQ
jgi:hypothetical protein